MAKKPIVNAAAGRDRSAYVWKMHNGTHMYCATNNVGVATQVLGAIAPTDDDKYVGCILNKMSSYTLYDSLNHAMTVVESIIALED